ncbi:MAG: hypothetical protein NTX23_08340 [Candidatus Bipolaricaulota bacterium]|nr:hypothetical protein [Candidatus Bipolaricaulota bacterium]
MQPKARKAPEETFRCSLPKAGFRWASTADGYYYESELDGLYRDTELERVALDKPEPWLVGSSIREQVEQTSRTLRRDGAVLRDVEALKADDPVSVLGFANSYGFLLGDKGNCLLQHPKSRGVFHGESLARWRREIDNVQEAIELWRMLGMGTGEPDRGRLHSRIVFNGETAYYREAPEEEKLLARWAAKHDKTLAPAILHQRSIVGNDATEEKLLVRWVANHQTLGPARLHLRNLVNVNLAQRAGGLLLQLEEGQEAPAFRARLSAPTLLGEMWLQLAYGLVGRLRVGACLSCGKLIDASRDSKRRFCSDKCRQQAYRARGMVRSGKTISQVATATARTIANVEEIVGRGRS